MLRKKKEVSGDLEAATLKEAKRDYKRVKI